MKTPIMLAGLATLFLLGSKSSNKSIKEKSKNDNSPIIHGNIVCSINQYKNNENKCVNFWIDGETEEFVLTEINNQIKKLQDQSFDGLCKDKIIDEFNGEYALNDNLITVVKNTIKSLWPSITDNDLPPKKNAPHWIKTIWIKTLSVYTQKICGNAG